MLQTDVNLPAVMASEETVADVGHASSATKELALQEMQQTTTEILSRSTKLSNNLIVHNYHGTTTTKRKSPKMGPQHSPRAPPAQPS